MMIERNTTTLSNKQKTMNISLTKRSIHPGAATLFSFIIVWRPAVLTTTLASSLATIPDGKAKVVSGIQTKEEVGDDSKY